MVAAAGFEPAVTRFQSGDVSQTTPHCDWSTRRVMLPQPPVCKAGALLLSYGPVGTLGRNRTCTRQHLGLPPLPIGLRGHIPSDIWWAEVEFAPLQHQQRFYRASGSLMPSRPRLVPLAGVEPTHAVSKTATSANWVTGAKWSHRQATILQPRG